MANSISNTETEGALLVATFELGGDDSVFGIDATLIQEVVMVGEKVKVGVLVLFALPPLPP